MRLLTIGIWLSLTLASFSQAQDRSQNNSLTITELAVENNYEAVNNDEAEILAEFAADSLYYYLVQAFNAATATQRISLNHIGVQLEQIDGAYIVSSVLDGYPAHLAGIQRADKIISVDGLPYHPIDSFNRNAKDKANFTPNTETHNLTLRRGERELSFEILSVYENLYDSFRSASLNSVMEFGVGNKVIGYVHFWGLSRSSNDIIYFEEVLAELANTDGIIVDIRDSFGHIGTEHFDQIFPSQRSYYQLSDISNPSALENLSTYNPSTISRHRYYGQPLAVLQNRNTQAGMELFSYQLSKLQRVESIGETTAGRLGKFSQVGPGDAASNILYTGNTELRADETAIESIGIAPDHFIDYSLTTPVSEDPQYAAAVQVLMSIM